jgi:carbonic anhydrase
MKAPVDWLAVTLLIGLIGPPQMAAHAVDSLRVGGSDKPEQAQSATAQQSPIDIRGDDLQVVKKQTVPPLTFHYSTHATVDLENTGSPNEEATVRANVAAGDGEIRVGDRVYRLVQFHFHTPAEHEVDEQRFPMEMHLVHKAADSSTLVVGVFLRAGAANATLAPMFSQLPKQSGAHAKVTPVNIKALIPAHPESARYTGSLTTPPFTEGVRWIVIAPPIELSKDQIAAFAALFPEGNSRGIQTINGRHPATDDSHFERDEGVSVKRTP